jgi:UDP:flavonoid glycosyltransferase YjiC (YdhE family)
MLVVPFAYDQPDNAARLVRLGVARTIGSGSYTAARSVRALQKLVTDPMYQTNADRIARIVKAEDGAGAACDALENCASV